MHYIIFTTKDLMLVLVVKLVIRLHIEFREPRIVNPSIIH
jgi:hypothetical protein